MKAEGSSSVEITDITKSHLSDIRHPPVICPLSNIRHPPDIRHQDIRHLLDFHNPLDLRYQPAYLSSGHSTDGRFPADEGYPADIVLQRNEG